MVKVYLLGIEYKGDPLSENIVLPEKFLIDMVTLFIEKKEQKNACDLLNSVYRIGILIKSRHDFYCNIKDFAYEMKSISLS